MDQTIEVCGVKLDNSNLENMVRQAEEAFRDDRLYVVDLVNGDLLKALASDESLQKKMQRVDLAVVGDTAVADVLPDFYTLTNEAISQNVLLSRLFMDFVREQKSVYWLGTTEEQYEFFRVYIDKFYPGLMVAGAFAFDPEAGVEETVINDINRVMPDVILSRLPVPYQEQFICEHGAKINGRLWIGISDKFRHAHSAEKPGSKIKAMIDKTILRRIVNSNS